MSGPLAPQALLDQQRQFVVRRAGAHRRTQIDLSLVEQAPAEVSVRREPRPVAGATEGLGHRRDDSDLPAERPAVALERVVDEGRPGATVVQAVRLEAQLVFESRADARGGEHLQLLAPAVSL